MVEGWTPEIGGALVAEGRFRARESTMRRTKGQGSIVTDETESETEPPLQTSMGFPRHVCSSCCCCVRGEDNNDVVLCYNFTAFSLSLSLFH